MKPVEIAYRIGTLIGFFVVTGCERRSDQYTKEAQTAHEVIWLIKMHEIDHPGTRVTNLGQLFANREPNYPYSWHRRFGGYGKDCGFVNSIFEKYAFLPPGVTNKFIEGEILAINAKPFPDQQGDGRIIISRVGTGPQDYRRRWVAEEHIQQVFREAGLQIPKPTPMPPPPPEPPSADAAFRKAAEKDLEGAIAEYERRYPTPFWRKSQWQAAGAVLAVAILGAIVWWSRRRRRY